MPATMTQFQQLPRPHVPIAQALDAYRASQAGMPPFSGREPRPSHRSRSNFAGTQNRPHASSSIAATAVSDPTLAPAYEALWLKPGAPLTVVKAAYRSLAAQTHPDVGGDPAAMLRLNSAYETLRQTLE